MNLSLEQSRLHERAVTLSREHRRIEWQLVETLEAIDRMKLHHLLGYSSSFQYCVHLLGLSESVAYSFISVARKWREVPELREALRAERLTVSKASRMV